MNLKIYFPLVLFVLLLFNSPLFSQKTMLLNEELKANSISYPIKRKGMNAVGKFTYGPYRTVNPKGGMTTSTSGNLFKSDVKAASKRKYSYDLVQNETDTVSAVVTEIGSLELDDRKSFFYRMITNVDIQINDNFSVAIGDQPEYEIVKNLQQTDAKFIEKSSGDAWQCIIVIPMDPNLEGYFFGGLISYQDKDITILEVKKNDQNKNQVFMGIPIVFIYGYEFFQDGRIIASLQTYPMNKQNVWFRTDLDDKTQKIIASAIPVLISKNMTANDIDYKYGEDE